MEDSMISTNLLSKSLISSDKEDCSSDQESSWTSILEDFKACHHNTENENEDDFFFSGRESSSMVSFSGYSAKKKQRFENDERNDVSDMKRRRITAACVDHDLEDTASSPDHSAKMNDFNQLYMNFKDTMCKSTYKEQDLLQTLNKQQHNGLCAGVSQVKGETSNIKDELHGKERWYTELRRKGLCLVPVSMLFDCAS